MRILVVTGASGGHIFPALSFLDALKDKNVNTLLILPRYCLKYNISWKETRNYKVNYISISAIKLDLDFTNFVAILKFFHGSLESLLIILRFRPDIVVGFGSLVSVPIVLLAWIFRIRTLIHEQNVIPGRANRLLAKFTDRIAISFLESRDYLKSCSKTKIVFTGNPVRREFIRINKNKALDFFGLDSDKFTILVMGGSLGSHRINIEFLNAISRISDRHKLQIIHLSGRGDYALLKYGYRVLNINIKLFDFLEPMHYAYNACDLVISRAGATTIAEIIFFRLPAIIIPYPFAYGHQASNAELLQSQGCAMVIKDNELGADILRQAIEKLLDNPGEIKRMSSGYDAMSKSNANDLLVDEVLSLT